MREAWPKSPSFGPGFNQALLIGVAQCFENKPIYKVDESGKRLAISSWNQQSVWIKAASQTMCHIVRLALPRTLAF